MHAAWMQAEYLKSRMLHRMTNEAPGWQCCMGRYGFHETAMAVYRHLSRNLRLFIDGQRWPASSREPDPGTVRDIP